MAKSKSKISPKPKEHSLADVRQVESQPPDGQFDGQWSGYVITFKTPMGVFRGLADIGVRGIDVACIVTVKSGKTSVRLV